MKNKRYINNVYPIAGVEWMAKEGLNDDDGILFSTQNISTASDRSQIANTQRLIKWSELKAEIVTRLILTTILLGNIPAATTTKLLPIYVGTNDEGKFTFDQIGEGSGIVLTEKIGYVEIGVSDYLTTGLPMPKMYQF